MTLPAVWLVLCVEIFADAPCQPRLWSEDPMPATFCPRIAANLIRAAPGIKGFRCPLKKPSLPLVPARVSSGRFA